MRPPARPSGAGGAGGAGAAEAAVVARESAATLGRNEDRWLEQVRHRLGSHAPRRPFVPSPDSSPADREEQP